jgi:AAA domain
VTFGSLGPGARWGAREGCDAGAVALVWVTGNSGAGKSTVCAELKRRGELAVDADWEGYSHWVDRASGRVVTDPPYPAPAGWLNRYGWQISRAEVAALAGRADGTTAFLCGSAENEADVRDLFNRMVCLVVDTGTLRDRLVGRTSNAFGQHPEELAAALDANDAQEAAYRRLGATIIDGTRGPGEVADAVLAAGTARSPSS